MSEDSKIKYINNIQEKLGKDVPWLGFYTFGEIAPVGGKKFLHNYTGVILGIKTKS